MKIDDLKVAIYADGAEIAKMKEAYKLPYIKGFTTNPSLMKKAGVTNYVEFAKEVIREIPDLPLSMEVFADDFEMMEKEAKEIASWGNNIFVKIPIMNSNCESSIPLIEKLSREGLKLNITAIFTLKQVKEVLAALTDNTQNIISVFAGRVNDAGVDAELLVKEAALLCKDKPGTMLLWASVREVFNIIQADRSGADIITVTDDILKKLHLIGKDLTKFSCETVKMFVADGKSLGFSILK